MDSKQRIIALIDMDCFYVQVEQRRNPSIRGKPCAVVQYNKWKGGGIIAVSYEARDKGVTRQMRGDDAKKACPDIILCKVPTANEKADLTRYRDAGAEVIQVLLQFGGIVERASIDEAYIDLTTIIDKKLANKVPEECVPETSKLQNTHVVGKPSVSPLNDNKNDVRLAGLKEYLESCGTDAEVVRLAMAAVVVEEIRAAIYQQTSFRCSAGISHNKMLSKLACGINKPNKQTILPFEEVAGLFLNIKIGKIRNLGGKLGCTLQRNYGIEKIGQLTEVPSQTLLSEYGEKTGRWLYEICRGIDYELVKERHVAQSVGCSKNFTGADALDTRTKVKKWLECLATELVERLQIDKEKNNRIATNLTAHVGLQMRKAVSRVCPIDKYDIQQVLKYTLSTLEQLNETQDNKSDAWTPAITMIGISAKNFKDVTTNEGVKSKNVATMFAASVLKSPKQAKEKSDTICSPPPKKRKKHSIEMFLTPNETTTYTQSILPQNGSNKNDQNLLTQEKCTNSKTSKDDTKNNKTVNKQKGTLFDTKMSFFSHLKKKNKPDSMLCKIDQAFMNSKNKQDQKTEVPENCQEKESMETKPALTQSYHQDEEEQQFKMDNIDLNVLNSLPLYLQHDIKANCMKSPKKTKKLPPNKTSISKYLKKVEPNFTTKEPQTGGTKKRTAKKGLIKATEKKHLPMGFFRARTQASNAIHLALTKKSEQANKNKKEIAQTQDSKLIQENENNLKSTDKECIKIKGDSQELWSSAENKQSEMSSYLCNECNNYIPIDQESCHSDYHLALSLQHTT